MYRVGNGVTKDSSQSMEWYLRAAKEGDAEAQASVAYEYFDGGEWVEKDLNKAYAWGYLSANDDGKSGKSIMKMMDPMLSHTEKKQAVDRATKLLAE